MPTKPFQYEISYCDYKPVPYLQSELVLGDVKEIFYTV